MPLRKRVSGMCNPPRRRSITPHDRLVCIMQVPEQVLVSVGNRILGVNGTRYYYDDQSQ